LRYFEQIRGFHISFAIFYNLFIINASEMSSTILIIGAGAAGLMAAHRLAGEGFSVTLLEASTTPGGRMHTFSVPGFTGFVEAGAEFVHGDLPITLQLAAEAGIALIPTRYSQLKTHNDGISEPTLWDELMKEMARLEGDMPVAQFLATHFSGPKYAGLRRSVQGYAEGYDLADLSTASTRALFSEWSNEEDSSSYRVEGGYGRLVDYLAHECGRLGVKLHFGAPVKEVHWQEGRVEVMTAGDIPFSADQLIVTASLGALPGIVFDPSVPDVMEAAAGIGYGSVIKILIEFGTSFWRAEQKGGHTLFILSRQPVPTWWTQSDESSNLLTGWLTGENMRRFRTLDPAGQIERCLSSLAGIFSREPESVRDAMKAFRIFDWEQQPYVHGGYSFDKVTTPGCRRLLQTPIMDTLYFAGEAIYGGTAPGTVEAAFHSGVEVAKKIIARH
jgi:monoamine oxidase